MLKKHAPRRGNRTPAVEKDVLYFAYGSNMFEKRLREARRAPSAAFLCVGLLSSHKLCFHKRGEDGSGKCNIVPTNNQYDQVYGVLFRIDPFDWLTLDRTEGVPNGNYRRAAIDVMRMDNRKLVSAQTYLACAEHIDDALMPFDWYHALVLAGAKEHRLPKKYILNLGLMPKVRDYDEERRNLYKALIKSKT